MKMTNKIIIAVVSIFIVMLLIGNFIYGSFFRSHILEEETKQVKNQISSVLHYIEELKKGYVRTANDWGHWNETYNFITSQNSDYVRDYLNLKDFLNLNASFIIFLDKDRIIEAKYYDYELGNFIPVPPGLLTAIEENIDTWSTDETNPLLINSGEEIYIAAITSTQDSLMKKPANGKLIIGRHIDKLIIQNIEKIANAKVQLSTLGKIEKNIAESFLLDDNDTDYQYFVLKKKDQVSAYVIMPGFFDSSEAIVLNMDVPRDMFLAEMKALHSLALLYSVVLLIIAFLSLIFTKKYIIEPLLEMTGKLKTIDPGKEHLDKLEVQGNNEFAILGNTINNLLGAIEEERDKQKLIAEKLRESERSKSVLLSNLPGMAYRCCYDRDWTMLFVSEGCYGLTGYKPDSLINNKVISYNDLISEEYRDYLWDVWTRSLELKIPVRLEYQIITAFGEIKWVFEQGRGIFDAKGKVIALEGLIIDITDRKKREEEIQYLNYHDIITGLYNRSYFDDKKKELNKKNYLPLSIIIGDINGLKIINDALGHAEGDKLISQTAMILLRICREQDVLARIGGDEFGILLPNTDADSACELMKQIQDYLGEYNNNTANEAHYVNISLGYATRVTMEQDIDQVMKQAEDYMYKRKLLEHKSSHSAIISSIKTTMFERSQETEQHAHRLTALSKKVGMVLNLTQAELDELELLATLHDIGKVGIDDKILKKNGKLTDEEWVEMKKHPEIGFRIAMASTELVSIADFILTHHERWDGKGYPQGLAGEDIPLLSRILAVVDSYDAMTQDRIYRKAISHEEAIAEIKENAGTQFDPRIAAIFLEIIERDSEIGIEIS